ncbi:hypothetical protein D3C80_1170180 [compost metagenome]
MHGVALARQVLICPRVTLCNSVSVKEFRAAYCAKNFSRTEPNAYAPTPSQAASSTTKISFSPRPNVTGPAPGRRRVMTCALREWIDSSNFTFTLSSAIYNDSRSRKAAAPALPSSVAKGKKLRDMWRTACQCRSPCKGACTGREGPPTQRIDNTGALVSSTKSVLPLPNGMVNGKSRFEHSTSTPNWASSSPATAGETTNDRLMSLPW